MSIASEITRLQGVKSDILQAISDKGVVVPAGSALDDCPGLIASISGGGGDVPEGYERLLYIYINGTGNPQINSNSWVYTFKMPSFTFGDEIDVLAEIKVDTSIDGDNELHLISRNQDGADRSFIFRQMKNIYSLSYQFDIRLMGPYNGLDTTYTSSDPNNSNGFYRILSGATENGLFVDLNGERRTGSGDKNIYADLAIFDQTNYTVYNGTKLFYIKIGDKINLVPCKRINDGQIGMFCTINEKFIYPNFSRTSWSGGIPI